MNNTGEGFADTAIRALKVAIKNCPSATMIDSAKVCLDDAQATYDRGRYWDALNRAEAGLRYLPNRI